MATPSAYTPVLADARHDRDAALTIVDGFDPDARNEGVTHLQRASVGDAAVGDLRTLTAQPREPQVIGRCEQLGTGQSKARRHNAS